MRGLHVSAPLNIGVDKQDARVPDVGVFVEGTKRTSPAFLSTAELVVEVLCREERPGDKLDFYGRWGVREYLEIDARSETVRLLRLVGADPVAWDPSAASEVLPFRVEGDGLVATAGPDDRRYRIDWPGASV